MDEHELSRLHSSASTDPIDMSMHKASSFPRPKWTAAAPLVLLLPLLSTVAESRYEPIDIDIQFNLRTQPIDALLQQVRQHLIDNTPRYTIAGHSCLAPKDAAPGSPPGRWLKVHLVGETDNDRATLAISDGDIYILAFADISGRWHAFPGYDTLFPGGKNLTATGDEKYGESYYMLLGSRDALTTVPLGRAAALRAVRVLSRYDRDTSNPTEVKRAMVTFMITISEGLRFFSIRAVYTHNWEAETKIDDEQAKLVVAWGDISRALYFWENNPNRPWDGRGEFRGPKKVGVTSADIALDTVDLLKRPKVICINSKPK